MSTKPDLNTAFYQPILKSVAVIIGGFFLAPTDILLHLYQAHPIIKSLVIFMGFFIVFLALINMALISLRVIVGAESRRMK
jgi:hypothetical protein